METINVGYLGIGDKYKKLLSLADIDFVEQLQNLGDDKKQRDVSNISGIPIHRIKDWHNNANLLKVDKVKASHLELFNAAGVNSILDLKHADPSELTRKLYLTNLNQSLVDRTPFFNDVVDMIKSAKKLAY